MMNINKKIFLTVIGIMISAVITVYASEEFGSSDLSQKIEDQKTSNYNSEQVIQDNDIVLIKIFDIAPESFEQQKSIAFKLLEPYLTNKITKASVLWQKDDYSYGKIASVSRVYIQDFLRKKINKECFINHFSLRTIDPSPKYRNNISKNSISHVEEELIIKSYSLRQKADIYRLSERYESALRTYNQVLDLNPNDSLALFWIAEIYKNKKDYKLAREYYKKVLSVDDAFWSADEALYELEKKQDHQK